MLGTCGSQDGRVQKHQSLTELRFEIKEGYPPGENDLTRTPK